MEAMQPGLVPQWTLADRLTKARKHAGLSQEQLADRLYVDRNTVGNYERDSYKHERKEKLLKGWALATGVSYEWLLYGTETGPDGGGEQPEAHSRCIARPSGDATNQPDNVRPLRPALVPAHPVQLPDAA